MPRRPRRAGLASRACGRGHAGILCQCAQHLGQQFAVAKDGKAVGMGDDRLVPVLGERLVELDDCCDELGQIHRRPGFRRRAHGGGAGGGQAALAADRLWGESLAYSARRIRILDHLHSGGRCSIHKRRSVCVGHPADEALTLALGHGHGESSRVGRRFAAGQNNLGEPAAQETPEIEPRSSAELLELQRPQLRHRFVLGQLPSQQLTKDVPQSPARTSRMCCQWVPAQ